MPDQPDDLTKLHVPASGVTPPADAPSVPNLTVLRELGVGGMGRVYLARHARLKRDVALKVMREGTSATDLVRFRAEAAAVASINHPNVITIHETGEADGRPFLVLEYAPGGSLDGRLKAGRLPHVEAASLLEQVSRGVAAAHLRGVVHRDLKPANVLLAADGTPKVGDFGLAKVSDATDAGVTREGHALGTPAYMPPEQARGDTDIGPPADVWSLGVMLYELLTGVRPFRGGTHDAVFHAILFTEPARPRAVDRSIPRDLETICQKCLAKRPQDRYASAGELADDLERWRNVEPIIAKSVSSLERAGKWARRNPMVAVSGMVVVLAAVAAGWFGLRAREEAARADARTVEAVASEGKARDALAEARGQKAAAERELERAEDLVTAGLLERAQQLWEKEPVEALEVLDRVRWDHRERLEYRIVAKQMLETGQHTLRGHDGAVNSVSWSPDGSRLTTSGDDRTIRVRDARSGAEILTLRGHTRSVNSVSWSPDGLLLATASDDKTVRVWDARSGAELRTLRGHEDGVKSIKWSPDGTRLATGGTDNTARIWDARSGIEIVTIRHIASLCLDWSPDGSRIAVVVSKAVCVYDLNARTEILRFGLRLSPVNSIA